MVIHTSTSAAGRLASLLYIDYILLMLINKSSPFDYNYYKKPDNFVKLFPKSLEKSSIEKKRKKDIYGDYIGRCTYI